MKRKVVYLRWKTPACEVIDQLNDLLADHGLELVNLEEDGSIGFALVVRKKWQQPAHGAGRKERDI